MKTTRCDNCRGKGTLLGLGGIEKDCNSCSGVGHIEAKETKEEKITEAHLVRGKNGKFKKGE